VTYKLAALRFRSVGSGPRGSRTSRSRSRPRQTAAASRRTPSSGCTTAAASPASWRCCMPCCYRAPPTSWGARSSEPDRLQRRRGHAHVIAVWEPAGASRTLLGEADGLLVTGAVHEWTDLRRPAQPEASRDRLTTLYYTFHAVREPWTSRRCRSPMRRAYPAADGVPRRPRELARPYGQRRAWSPSTSSTSGGAR